MLSRQNLLEYLNQILLPENFEDYCPNGLQVEGKVQLKKIAFAVSSTQESLKKSVEWGADALVAHHGLFWKHQGARAAIGPFGERLKLAIKNDLNVIAYHLPLDAHPEVGNAAALAKALELNNILPFGLYKRKPLGVKGELKTPMAVDEVEELLQKTLNHSIICASANRKAKIQKIGIITGGANNEWEQASREGLDAYLTGEISEYNWHDAREAGIHYFAGGHHATERFGVLALMEKMKMDFPSVEFKFFDSENPA